MFRTIPGVTDTTEEYHDEFVNPEFSTQKIVVRNAGNEYSLPGKKKGDFGKDARDDMASQIEKFNFSKDAEKKN
jgi:hypothetical protein